MSFIKAFLGCWMALFAFLIVRSQVQATTFYWGAAFKTYGKPAMLPRDEFYCVFTCYHGKRYGFKIQFEYNPKLHDLYGLRSWIRSRKQSNVAQGQ